MSPLPEDLQVYAALDGQLHLRIFHLLQKELKSHQMEPLVEAPVSIGEHQTVGLFMSGKMVGNAMIKRIGGLDVGVTKWGKTTVRKGQAVVSLETLDILGNLHPPYSFKKNDTDDTEVSWKKKDMTLQQLFDNKQDFMVKTSSLIINMTVM